MALRTVGKEDARVESTMTTMIKMVMIVIINVVTTLKTVSKEYARVESDRLWMAPGHQRRAGRRAHSAVEW